MTSEEDIDDKLLDHYSSDDWNLKLTASYQHL
jgi:hypothetical protein